MVRIGSLNWTILSESISPRQATRLPHIVKAKCDSPGEDGEPSELAKAGFKSPEQGASTTLWAAMSLKLAGMAGVYCEDAEVAALTDPQSPMARYTGVEPHACDDEAAERLWELSERWLNAA